MELSGFERLFVSIAGTNPIWQGLLGGVIITLLNTLGALAVLVWQNPSQKVLDSLLGFAAGVMLTASFTSLILPGVEIGGIVPVLVGIGVGALFLDYTDHNIPHLHAIMGHEGGDARVRRVWLFILAITIHNAPEGLAVGVGFGSGDLSNALALMLAIGLQNMPEGLAVAISAINIGKSAGFYAMFTGFRAGLIEIPLALFGAWAVQWAEPILPYAMGFAAGAMLYVISDEIVPETHRLGHERVATFGTMAGVMVMLYLDIVLG